MLNNVFRLCRVRWASKKQAGIKVGPTEKMPKDAPGTASIYVSFSCFNVMGDITEETLRADFQKYGEVMDVTIKYSTHDEVRVASAAFEMLNLT